MANEFVARNGLISQNNSTVTGSLTVTNGITGSLFGTASWASNATSSSFAGNSLTASYLNTLNQNLTFNGNLTLNGTASISYLDVRFESASVIYSSGSNQFGDASNDTQTLYGTVSIPTGPLVITGSIFYTGSGGGTPAVNIDNVLRITRTGGSTGITIDGSTGKVTGGGSNVVYEPYNYGDASHNFNIGHATVGNFNWSVGTNSTLSSNTQLMRLTRSGSLGIRTTNPAATLDVSGSVNISGSGVQVPLQVSSGSTPLLFVSRSGNVGIGTSTPTNTLDIQSTGTGSLRISGSGGSQITLVRPTAGLTGFLRYVGTTMELGTAGADPLNLYTGNTARLAIDTSGNVGIGIGAATPSARLHVSGASSATLLEIDSPTVNNIILVSGSGNISIRKSVPTATLDISGSTLITGSLNVSSGITGSLFGTSSWASNAGNASTIDINVFGSDVESYLLISNVAGTTGVAIGGDGDLRYNASQNKLTVGSVSATNLTGSHLGNTVGTASWASNAITASFVNTAQTASYVLQAVSSSFATNASTASYIQNAQSASYVLQAVSASYSTSASNADLLDGLHASSFVLNSQTSSMTVLSASFASTASYVNNLNQNVLITGSLTVGSSSLGASENTITLGARDTAGEGGQLGFNAPGGTYTSASMIDNYQNRLRVLRGTNAGSDAEVAWWSMHTKQMALPAYNSTSAFPGTAAATLAVDSSGNVITIAGAGGGTVTQVNTSGNVNGITLTGGPITTSGTVTLGGTLSNVQSSQLATSSLMIGNSSVSLGATASSLTGLTSVTATSFTGSLFGTSSWANNARTASFVTTAQTASYVQNAQSASYVLQAVSSSFASTASFVSSIASNITNNTDNYILTATGGSTINGESSLTFDGTLLKVTGQLEQGDGGVDARGTESHAEGRATIAVGNQSHAEGYQTLSSGSQSHAEGSQTVAKGQSSHAEGSLTLASGTYSHAEGYYTTASGNYAHAEGWNTQATGLYSHAEGISTYATQPGTHAEGNGGTAQAAYSHVEGHNTITNGTYSHAEGSTTTANGDYSHAEGHQSNALGNYSHAEGNQTTSTGPYSHAEGSQTDAKGNFSHAEGTGTKARGAYSHTEGILTETGTVYGFAAGNDIAISGGVVTIDSTYGDLLPIFRVGNFLLLDDADYDATYGRAYYRIVSKSFDGSRTAIYLSDTTVATSVAIVGDPAYYTSWNSYAGNMSLYGPYSHAEGYNTIVLTDNSHAEGNGAVAAGFTTHAEGNTTVALGEYSHAEGNTTVALGESSHTEGVGTYTYGIGSHAEGNLTKTGIFGYNSTSIVSGVITLDASYGDITTVISSNTYIVLYDTEFDNLYGTAAFRISSYTFTGGQTEITLDNNTVSTTRAFIGSPAFSAPTGADRVIPGLYSHTEGYNTSAAGLYSHAEGSGSIAIGIASHAEGQDTIASGNSSHAEGWRTQAIGVYAHAEGRDTVASGSQSHAEGRGAEANGSYSHAEGESTQATNTAAHAEGTNTVASGTYSHAEGQGTTASGQASHAEGNGTTASGTGAHAEGAITIASGLYAHAEGLGTKASGDYQHAQGLYNIEDTFAGAFIVGNGSSDGNRSNLIYAAGTNVQITGSLRGQVSALSIASNTASINLATNNFFTVNLVNGANTHISASNIRPGQTINLRVSQSSAGTGTVSFNSAIEQASGAAYTGSMIANAEDIVTFISFDSTKLYMSAIRNLV